MGAQVRTPTCYVERIALMLGQAGQLANQTTAIGSRPCAPSPVHPVVPTPTPITTTASPSTVTPRRSHPQGVVAPKRLHSPFRYVSKTLSAPLITSRQLADRILVSRLQHERLHLWCRVHAGVQPPPAGKGLSTSGSVPTFISLS